ncbi:low molecular weight protein-tyrosine-phosphatase [Xylella fastidiosa]|uniref:protein-tyrosine-phosphatase n=1 Tax=Xylella fastidiosa subsp. multiplex TaxID=644357 RepID=A0AAW6HWE9_XYLFS|nr:low molecular weight protein-tyrosine-phosphatase [Xylella fastidiosa]KFA40279.1 protein tyrosine phosphatase [Xylella fastidiosa]MCH7235179.1 low molecular weight phosphotyrosine protein phosphatase [Xylella fastidiosa subsp. multiplex]MCO5546422.1 protein tyrosine phosphatase [Xylella fastidiosa]MDC6409121.1 low molecular weight phosphotyrosine protein phosphatase [Xylella fastidiosa subsp. multiplex]MDC7970831.1 low molecular weight phosphotyrosine protein phosphatase [Xylella fastidiosa
MRLLVVCLGNICRSPMGEGALRKHITASGKNEEIAVDSAGTSHWHIGQPPDARAVHCARSHGIDISTLRARQVHHADFEHFDWLLCADASNQCDLLRLAPPGTAHKIVLWLPWAGITQEREIPDPYLGDAKDFEHVWQLIDTAAQRSLARLTRT